MKITIRNPIRIDGELVAAASLEGAILPGGWQVIRQIRSTDQLHGAENLSGSTFLSEPLMHMAPVAGVCHQMLRLRLGRGNG